MAEETAARAEAVPSALDRIAAAAGAVGLPMASHDDDSIAARDGFRARGARICEFPMAEEIAAAAAAAGDFVAMGCPNVVRGKSHLGWGSAARMAEAGICRVLTSDYYYPAMISAAFVLAERGVLDFARAWALMSENPAQAAGLTDRGLIDRGKRADLVIVDPASFRAVATIAGGRLAFIAAGGSERLTALRPRAARSAPPAKPCLNTRADNIPEAPHRLAAERSNPAAGRSKLAGVRNRRAAAVHRPVTRSRHRLQRRHRARGLHPQRQDQARSNDRIHRATHRLRHASLRHAKLRHHHATRHERPARPADRRRSGPRSTRL
jgi:Amidohydrolase family